jgi:hypothetical protein
MEKIIKIENSNFSEEIKNIVDKALSWSMSDEKEITLFVKLSKGNRELFTSNNVFEIVNYIGNEDKKNDPITEEDRFEWYNGKKVNFIFEEVNEDSQLILCDRK